MLCVSEYLPNGNLEVAIKKDKDRLGVDVGKRRLLGWYMQGRSIALDVARGLAFLHTHKARPSPGKLCHAQRQVHGQCSRAASRRTSSAASPSCTCTRRSGGGRVPCDAVSMSWAEARHPYSCFSFFKQWAGELERVSDLGRAFRVLHVCMATTGTTV